MTMLAQPSDRAVGRAPAVTGRLPRALMITQHYPPELLGSAPFCADIARWLAVNADGVAVVTGLPGYPDAERFAAFRAAAPRH